MILIREERAEDVQTIREINERAFGQTAEADIVDALREAPGERVSMVAESDGRVIGYILFSPAVIESKDGPVRGMGLAPMAVLPEHQRRGIGSEMVNRGLNYLRERFCPFVVVLGHPEYYPRFGFECASKYGIRPQWDDIPDETFMVLFLDPDAMKGVSGTAYYRDEFNISM